MKFYHFPFSVFRSSQSACWLQLFALLLLFAYCGCAKHRHLAQIGQDESIQWADVSSTWQEFESIEYNNHELTSLEDPDPIDSETESLEFENAIEEVQATFATERSAWKTLMDDQREFYFRQNARSAVFTLSTAAILANTTMDQEFADWYQDDVRTESLDDIADVAKLFGEQWPMVGLYVSTSVVGRWLDVDPRFAKWGDRSLRSMFVGVPPLLFLQKALGSSRPNDMPPTSEWNFWNDDNGASGHTFVGAVPFLVAAQLAERPAAKATWLALSTATGWSRINDNDHYLSQVIVGWWLAYAATNAVERSDQLDYEIGPALIGDSLGIEATWRR